MMRQRQVVDLGDVVPTRFEENTGPGERLRRHNASFIPHCDDASRCSLVEQWDDAPHSYGHTALYVPRRASWRARIVQELTGRSFKTAARTRATFPVAAPKRPTIP